MTKFFLFTSAVILSLLFSCKKEDKQVSSDMVFTKTCTFEEMGIRTVRNIEGVLSYTDEDTRAHVSYPEPVFVIDVPGELPMIICNMPDDFTMESGASRKVHFSGFVGVYPETVDAYATYVELFYLKWNEHLYL